MILCILLLSVLGTQNVQSEQQRPVYLVPLKYSLTVYTNLMENDSTLPRSIWGEQHSLPPKSFLGDISITIECKYETNQITLDFKELNVGSQPTLYETNTWIPGNSYNTFQSYVKNSTHLTITTKKPLRKNYLYILQFRYTGSLQSNFHGYYFSQYRKENLTYFAATTFGANPKSHAFPCFDDSSFTTTFDLTLVNHVSNHGFASTLLKPKKINRNGDWETVIYPTSEVMPIKEFGFMTITWDYNVEQGPYNKVVALIRQGINNTTGSYAAVFADAYLHAYSTSYFENSDRINGSQITLVVIPGLYSENRESRGFVRYRESTVLVNTKTSTIKKDMIESIVAYDMALHWLQPYFSQYATNSESPWLMEGIASYISRQVRGVETNSSTLETLLSVHYSTDFTPRRKGDYIMRMCAGLNKDNTFISQLRSFLIAIKRVHNGPISVNLINELSQALVSKPRLLGAMQENMVKAALDSWNGDKGYPLVTVSRKDNTIILTQKHYFKEDNSKGHWYLPLAYITSEGNMVESTEHSSKELFDKGICTINLTMMDDSWVILNPNVKALYKVMYDEDNWKRLISSLNSNHTKIPVLNRAQLVADLLDITWKRRETPFLQWLASWWRSDHLETYLTKNEKDYLPWLAALTRLNRFERIIRGHNNTHTKFMSRVRDLLTPIFLSLQGADKQLEALIYESACFYNLPEHNSKVQDEFTNRFNKLTGTSGEQNETLHLRRSLYCNHVKRGGWESMTKKYYHFTYGCEEKEDAIFALGCAASEDYINHALVPGTVDPADGFTLFKSVACREPGNKLVLKHLLTTIKNTLEPKADQSLFDQLEYFAHYVPVVKETDWNTIAVHWCTNVFKGSKNCDKLTLPFKEKIGYMKKIKQNNDPYG